MAQVDQQERAEWVVKRVESLVADVDRLEHERNALRARVEEQAVLERQRDELRGSLERVIDEQSGLERQRQELSEMLERAIDDQSELERQRDELSEAFGRLTRAVSGRQELTDGSEPGGALSTEVFYSRDTEENRRALPSGTAVIGEENGAATLTGEPAPARGRRFASAAEAPIEEAPEPNGGVAAAILAAAGACAALGLLVVAAELSASIEAWLTLYEPAGSLTGKTTVPVVLWLIAWPILHWVFKEARVPMRNISRTAWALVVIGLIGTFPPFYSLFALH